MLWAGNAMTQVNAAVPLCRRETPEQGQVNADEGLWS